MRVTSRLCPAVALTVRAVRHGSVVLDLRAVREQAADADADPDPDPNAGRPPASLSIRARCRRFQVMKVRLRSVKSLSAPATVPSSRRSP